MQVQQRAWQRVSPASKPLLGQIASRQQTTVRNRQSLLFIKPTKAARTYCCSFSRRRVAMVTASRSQPPRKQQPWGTRLAAVAVGLSLLVTLPWEKLDHEFPYDTSEVPDTGPQDKPRCDAGSPGRHQHAGARHLPSRRNPSQFLHVSAVNRKLFNNNNATST